MNHGWLCDKGRYGLEWIHSDHRLLEPQVRDGGTRREVSWPDALDRAADAIEKAKDLHGAGSIAVLGGARGTNEDAYVWSVLAKGVIGTDHVDAQLGDGLPADFVLGMDRAEIADLDSAAAIVVLDQDLRDQVPVLFLRLRRAVLELGVPARRPRARRPRAHPARGVGGAHRSRRAAGRRPCTTRSRASSAGRSGPVVVVVGRGNLAGVAGVGRGRGRRARAGARGPFPLHPAARQRARRARRRSRARIPSGPGHARRGPRLVHRSVGARSPREAGLDAEGILRAAADGKVRVLVLVGADPISDFPDATLARRALDAVDSIIVVDGFDSESTIRADVFLPATLWGEKAGTVTNLEGRVQRVGRKVAPEGTAMDDWRIAAELALRLGTDLDFATVDEVTDEMSHVAPAFAGLTARAQQERPRRRGPAGCRALRRDRAAHARPVDPGRRRVGYLLGPDQGRRTRGRRGRRHRGGRRTKPRASYQARASMRVTRTKSAVPLRPPT